MTRALIGCETSGVFRRAFAARWPEWDVWSCDLEPAEDGSNRHIVGDVRDQLNDGWDMLICHPPCTRLCNSGVRWLDDPRCKCPREATAAEKLAWPALDMDARRAVMRRLLAEGAALFAACWNAPIPRVAVENPVMHGHGAALLPADLPRPHIVQPWWFGEPFKKATGWYLRGLPQLVPTDRLTPPPTGSAEAKAWEAVHRASPGPNRARDRSRPMGPRGRRNTGKDDGMTADELRVELLALDDRGGAKGRHRSIPYASNPHPIRRVSDNP